MSSRPPVTLADPQGSEQLTRIKGDTIMSRICDDDSVAAVRRYIESYSESGLALFGEFVTAINDASGKLPQDSDGPKRLLEKHQTAAGARIAGAFEAYRDEKISRADANLAIAKELERLHLPELREAAATIHSKLPRRDPQLLMNLYRDRLDAVAEGLSDELVGVDIAGDEISESLFVPRMAASALPDTTMRARNWIDRRERVGVTLQALGDPDEKPPLQSLTRCFSPPYVDQQTFSTNSGLAIKTNFASASPSRGSVFVAPFTIIAGAGGGGAGDTAAVLDSMKWSQSFNSFRATGDFLLGPSHLEALAIIFSASGASAELFLTLSFDTGETVTQILSMGDLIAPVFLHTRSDFSGARVINLTGNVNPKARSVTVSAGAVARAWCAGGLGTFASAWLAATVRSICVTLS